MNNDNNALEIHNLAMQYPHSPDWVFRQLSFAAKQGEFVVVIGPSGCGKSTLLRLIAGLEHPAIGEIIINSKVVASAGEIINVPPEKRELGFIFQTYALWPHMDVRANISFPLEHGPIPKEQRVEAATNIMKKFEIDAYEKRLPAELSGGQRQRVALARALVNQPKLLLMDEPLSSLDVSLRKSIQNELLTLKKRWRPTVLYVTHDQEEAINLADRIIMLHEGAIEQQGTPYEIYHSPASSFVANFFGVGNEVAGTIVEILETGKFLIQVGEANPIIARGLPGRCISDTVNVLIRPSWIEISNMEFDEKRYQQGTIVSSHFQGANTNYLVDWQGYSITISQPMGAIKNTGDTIFFAIKDAWIQ